VSKLDRRVPLTLTTRITGLESVAVVFLAALAAGLVVAFAGAAVVFAAGLLVVVAATNHQNINATSIRSIQCKLFETQLESNQIIHITLHCINSMHI
jgi:hypothetical protein